MKFTVRKLKYALVLFFLFFAALNFRGKFFYFSFGAMLVLLVFQKRLRINRGAAVYALLGLLMAIYNHAEGMLSMIRCFAGVALFLVGYNVASEDMSRTGETRSIATSQRHIYGMMLAIATGSFTHFFLNFVTNWGAALGRNTNDIWTGETMAATGQAALSCLMLGFAVSAIFLPPRKVIFWLGAFCISIILLYNLILACRAVLAILVALLIVGYCYKQRTLDSMGKGFGFRVRVVIVLGIAAIAVILNVGNIQGLWTSSNLGARFNNSLDGLFDNTARNDSTLLYIKNAPKYLFGGLHMQKEFGYAHDLLLDGYDEYGIGGLILFVAVLAHGVKAIWKFLRETAYHHSLKLTVLCIYTAVLLEFCVEPILTGMPWLFPCYCLINGCIAGLNLTWSKGAGTA